MPKPGAMAIAAALLVALAVGGLFVFPLFNAPVEPTRQAREMPPMTEMFRALPKKATPPRLMVETTHIDFGTVEGTGEAFERTLNIAVRNDGGGRAAVKRAEYHGQKGIKLGNTCAGTALAAGEACDIQVVWRPEAEGHYKGVVIVTMPDPRPADPQAPVPAGPDEGLKQIEVTAELEGAPAAPAPTGPSELELAAAAAAAARRLGRGTAHVYAEPKPGHEARAVSLSDPDYGPPKPGFGLPVDRSRVITADRYIAGVLETGINSQLGGRAVAVVSRHVFGADDRLVLIPAGTRVIGHYQPLGAQGDTRLAITWTRLIRPDGAAIALEGLPAADQMGRAGMIGRIDSRIFERYGAPLLLSAISAAGRRRNTARLADPLPDHRGVRRGAGSQQRPPRRYRQDHRRTLEARADHHHRRGRTPAYPPHSRPLAARADRPGRPARLSGHGQQQARRAPPGRGGGRRSPGRRSPGRRSPGRRSPGRRRV